MLSCFASQAHKCLSCTSNLARMLVVHVSCICIEGRTMLALLDGVNVENYTDPSMSAVLYQAGHCLWMCHPYVLLCWSSSALPRHRSASSPKHVRMPCALPTYRGLTADNQPIASASLRLTILSRTQSHIHSISIICQGTLFPQSIHSILSIRGLCSL